MLRPAKSAAGELPVATVADARAALSSVLRRFRSDPDAEPVVIGSHRRPEGVLLPIGRYRQLMSVREGPGMPVLEILRQRRQLILRLARMSNIGSVAVFGSVARGEERPDSDVDLLVDPAIDASLFDLAQFADDMESLLGRRTDVVSSRGLDAERDSGILHEAVEL
jgi:uncharacterized protein